MHDQTDCMEVVKLLYQYIDGELAAERRGVITRHLDDCAPCLDAYEFETELRVLVSRKCRDEVPEDLRQRVHEALRRLSEPPGSDT